MSVHFMLKLGVSCAWVMCTSPTHKQFVCVCVWGGLLQYQQLWKPRLSCFLSIIFSIREIVFYRRSSRYLFFVNKQTLHDYRPVKTNFNFTLLLCRFQWLIPLGTPFKKQILTIWVCWYWKVSIQNYQTNLIWNLLPELILNNFIQLLNIEQ